MTTTFPKTTIRLFFSIIFIGVLLENTQAQLSQGGTPIGLQTTNIKFAEINSSLSNPLSLQEPNIDSLRSIAEASDSKNNPYIFANSIKVDLDIKSKSPVILEDKAKLWIWKFTTKKALSLNAYFTKYKLAEGAKLFVYRPDGKRIAGAFSSVNNQEHNTLSVELIEGNELIIEYYEPDNIPAGASEIFLGSIGYGFRGVFNILNMSNINESDNCNINVNCSQGADYQVIKKSVAKIIFQATDNNWYHCSGSVVNNTAQNGIPYFLTAFHCYNQSLLNTYIFYFNYESPDCSNPTSTPASNTLTGATFKAAYSGSDFALLQINNTIPSSYNVYYAGWDKSDTAPSSAVSIHHPSGDIKKIAIDNHAPTKANVNIGGQIAASWRVSWDTGITEGGSSGSFLINSSTKHIIGQLFGGSSYCSTPSSPDFYGRLAVSWNGNGTASTRLKDWLDPLNTNANTLNGMYSNSIVTSVSGSSFCQGAGVSVSFTTTGTLNAGNVFTAQLSNNSGNFNSPTSIGTLTSTNSGTIAAIIPTNIPAGSGYRIRVVSSSPSITGTDNGTNITITAIPTAPSTNPASRCGAGTVALSASGCAGGTIKWFANATATTTLATGGTFTTPSISTNTTYYVGCTIGNCNSARNTVTATVNVTVVFNGATHAAGIYRASQTITSASNVPTQTSYYAAKAIILVPGFQAGNNETFLASIQNCP